MACVSSSLWVGLFCFFGLKALSVHLSVFSSCPFKLNVKAQENSSGELGKHVLMVVNCMCQY